MLEGQTLKDPPYPVHVYLLRSGRVAVPLQVHRSGLLKTKTKRTAHEIFLLQEHHYHKINIKCTFFACVTGIAYNAPRKTRGKARVVFPRRTVIK